MVILVPCRYSTTNYTLQEIFNLTVRGIGRICRVQERGGKENITMIIQAVRVVESGLRTNLCFKEVSSGLAGISGKLEIFGGAGMRGRLPLYLSPVALRSRRSCDAIKIFLTAKRTVAS